MLFLLIFCFMSITIPYTIAEDCELVDNCRIIDIYGSDEWVNIPGHYRSIQACVNDAIQGDTCLIRSGSYHETITIEEKNNLVIRGDPDFETPILDGTVAIEPNLFYDSDGDGFEDGNWKKELINGNVVCVGEIEIIDEKHPFQLFLEGSGGRDMMTNARWPNAVWADKYPDTGAPEVFYNKFWGKSDSKSTRGKMVDKKVQGISPLANSSLDMKGAMAVLNVGSWNTFVKPVKNHNAGDDFFTYDDDFGNINFKPGQNQYYLDSSEALLDNPGEWYYNMLTKEIKFMPLSSNCPESGSGAVRGRVIDYSISITSADQLYISNINFFASNINADARNKGDKINELYLDSLNFRFPSSSKRMLQDYSVPKITQVLAGNQGKISIKNCEFFGAEGSALYYWGHDAEIENNLFMWNDWSGQMDLTANGGFGTVYGGGHKNDETFESNTMWYNGASAGYRPGYAKGAVPKILNNLVVGQCDGKIMNDGSGIQLQTGSQPNSLTEGNWVINSPKKGIRFDDSPNLRGTNGTISKNVVWKTEGIMIKGDFHTVTSNLALDSNDMGLPGLEVTHALRNNPEVMNENTFSAYNAACLADGGIDMLTTPTEPWGRWPLAGLKSNNYYGNNSFHGGEDYDGSWILNGTTMFPDVDLPDLLMDVSDYDFRPKQDTVLTSTGVQIGPYPAAYSKNAKYTIAGRKKQKASFPIPSHQRTVVRKDALMFQSAYRCDNDEDKHMIYIANRDADFPPMDQPTSVLFGTDNIVPLNGLDIAIEGGEAYKWRVDCIEGVSNSRREGDVWVFTMVDE